MSVPISTDEILIEKLLAHLKAEGYSLRVQRWYPALVSHLLDYCNSNALAIDAIRSVHITLFLRRRYRLFRKRHGESPPFARWCHRYTSAINMLLRLVHGAWPVPDPPSTALEIFHRDLVDSYDAWLRDLRALCAATRTKRTTHALRFLTFLGLRADKRGIRDFDIVDELYELGGDRSRLHVLAESSREPLLYFAQWGAGRVHYNALGHNRAAISHQSYQRLLCQAVAWALDDKAAQVI